MPLGGGAGQDKRGEANSNEAAFKALKANKSQAQLSVCVPLSLSLACGWGWVSLSLRLRRMT